MYSVAQWGGREKWWAGPHTPTHPVTRHSYALHPLQEKVKRKFTVFEGDHLTLLNVYRAFEKVGRGGEGPTPNVGVSHGATHLAAQYGKSSQWCGQNFLNYRGLVHAGKIREQLKRLLRRAGVGMQSCGDDEKAVQKCITAGFFANAAQLHSNGEYRYIDPSPLTPPHPTPHHCDVSSCLRTVRGGRTLSLHPWCVLSALEQPPDW